MESPRSSLRPVLFTYDFQIFGLVRGVSFIRHTLAQAKSWKLRGWVKRGRKQTIRGHVEGPYNELNELKNWLTYVGSPRCQIKKAIFSELLEIPNFGYLNFSRL